MAPAVLLDQSASVATGAHPADPVASSSKSTIVGDSNTHSPPAPVAPVANVVPKKRWRPSHYATEHPQPPPPDHKLEEEAAAQAAAQAAGYEGRRQRRFMQRRTVDFNAAFELWAVRRTLKTNVRDDKGIRPSLDHIVDLLPPAAYRDSAQAVTTNLVHTSTNKIRNPVNVVVWQPDGRRLLTGSQSGEFTLWNSLTFNFETILQAHDHPIRSIKYSRSGQWIISCDQGGTIKYFQSNMNNLQAFQGHREAVRALSFSPDDGRFVSASDDSTLKIWAFDEAREEKSLKGHGWDAKCVEWHPFKGLIVSGSKDNLIKYWDPRTGTNLSTFHGHKNTVQAVRWSRDGNLVASASRDQVVKLYDIRAMAELATLKGHPKEVCSVDWHPDHHDLLATGGSDGSLLFWSTLSTDPSVPVHSVLEAHESNIWTMAWHPLSQVLATGSSDHTTRFWQRARPEDGRREEAGAEGQAAAAASKAERLRKAARGGEEWDDDFIPGLTSRRPPLPQRDHALPNHGAGGWGGVGGGAPPGLGGAQPPPFGSPLPQNGMPPLPQSAGAMAANAPIPGLGGAARSTPMPAGGVGMGAAGAGPGMGSAPMSGAGMYGGGFGFGAGGMGQANGGGGMGVGMGMGMPQGMVPPPYMARPPVPQHLQQQQQAPPYGHQGGGIGARRWG